MTYYVKCDTRSIIRRILMLLEDRVAIITGGAKGMGKGMAIKFAEEGCSVVIADISMREASDTVAGLSTDGLAVQCDVTEGSQVQNAVEKTVEKYGKIDILVNNAGAIAPHKPVEDITEEEWDRVLALNLKSHFFFCKYVVPHMKKQKYGKIINISSIGAVQPPAHEIHYNTAKAGIIGFTYDLGKELAPLNITVNAILPGPIRTSFYERTTGSMADDEKEVFFAALGKKVPMQRAGTPEDIAGAALFLASELSAFITCETIYVTGGLPQLPST
jgi:NAD(P)-dependent dehydrogenase (short-subunit alcohol dehydrogenase family)